MSEGKYIDGRKYNAHCIADLANSMAIKISVSLVTYYSLFQFCQGRFRPVLCGTGLDLKHIIITYIFIYNMSIIDIVRLSAKRNVEETEMIGYLWRLAENEF